jgi:hypothetical protein
MVKYEALFLRPIAEPDPASQALLEGDVCNKFGEFSDFNKLKDPRRPKTK